MNSHYEKIKSLSIDKGVHLSPSYLGIYLLIFFIATLPSLHSFSFITGWYNEKRLAQISVLTIVCITAISSKNFQASILSHWGTFPSAKSIFLSTFFLFGSVSATQAALPHWAMMEVATYFLLVLVTCYITHKLCDSSLDKLIIVAFCVSVCLYAFAFASTLLAGVINDVIDYHYLLSGFINRRFLNQFQSISFPILLVAPLLLKQTRKLQLSLIFIAAFWFMLMLVSDGRGVLLSSLVGILLSCFLLPFNRWRWLLTSGIVIAIGCLMFAIFDSIVSAYEVTDSSTFRPGTGGRLPIWLEVIHIIYENPLLGIGPMQLAFTPSNFTVAHPHNITLQLMVEWGVPAAASLMVLSIIGFVLWIKQQRQIKNPDHSLVSLAITSSLIASVIHGHLSGVFVMPLSQLSFTLIVGWMLAKYKISKPITETKLTPSKYQLYAFPLLGILALTVLLKTSYPQVKAMITSAYPEKLYFNGEYPSSTAPRFWSRTFIKPSAQ